jgi:hypothetical protein
LYDDDGDDDDEDGRSCSDGSSMIFISLPAVDEYLNVAASADQYILTRNVGSPSVGVHHVVCAILGHQQDMKHGIPHAVDLKWIKTSMARPTSYVQSMVVNLRMRLMETKERFIVVV